jgi:hypothetical protein
LLLGVIYSRIHWSVKSLLIGASLMFSWFFYSAYVTSLGYPTIGQLPEYFRYVASVVHEPYPIKNDPGAIYIWLTTDEEMPRAFVVPYSVETRQLMSAAKKRMANGEMIFMGTKSPQASFIGSNPGKKANGNTNGNSNKSGGNNAMPYGDTLEIKQPPDTVPKKEGTNNE